MKRRLQGGFSLVEMLIGLMLTALILQAIPPLLSTAFVSWRQSVARTATHQSGRMALEAMTRELRLASQIVSPLPGQAAAAVSVDTTDETGKTSRLTFRLGTNLGANRRTLYRISGGGQPTPLTEDTVSELRFWYKPPHLLVIDLTLTDRETGLCDSLTSAVTCLNLAE